MKNFFLSLAAAAKYSTSGVYRGTVNRRIERAMLEKKQWNLDRVIEKHLRFEEHPEARIAGGAKLLLFVAVWIITWQAMQLLVIPEGTPLFLQLLSSMFLANAGFLTFESYE